MNSASRPSRYSALTIRLDANWHRKRPVKHAKDSLTTMDAACSPYAIAFLPRMQWYSPSASILGRSCQHLAFNHRDEVLALLEYVHWWKAATRSGAASHPVARDASI
jgi:hypothetical protein